MSTRWYPLYQKGNPQRRVFLPNFWLKMVKPVHKQPKNVVQFHCSMEMTKFDVRNYLEKIYGVYPAEIRTRIAFGSTRREPHKFYIIKDEDVKIAYVVLPKNQEFEYPELFTKSDAPMEKEENLEEIKKEYGKMFKPNKMPGFPSWFRIQ
ncbi:probable 39S ribosomal protein L23, mitochondrial [Colletes gigas]|uniref:probable 39S ribosomal protein L23, mitochondrial n=1 Tax=Colletes gigas TaxID=935657 RepID=UPI001C9ADC17|nr:probable 39S ribosomal protein L23, mitochondrial [Colletes gigas]